MEDMGPPTTILNLTLLDTSASASSQAKSAHQRATSILNDLQATLPPSNSSHLPSTLLSLLTQVIKPLFSHSTQHNTSLTPTGRPTQYPNSTTTSTLNHFTPTDISSPKPWKQPFTLPLLSSLIATYPLITPTSLQRETVEAHFFLLCPALLNIIDDYENAHKATGANLIRSLCDVVCQCESDIVARSGMAEVFFASLRGGWSCLPTLVEEGESRDVVRETGGAWVAVVVAMGREVELEVGREKVRGGEEKRLQKLREMMGKGVVFGLGHLDVGRGVRYVRLTSVLMRQMKVVVEMMDVEAVVFLKDVLPLCRAVLMDPFVLGAGDLVEDTLGVVQCVMKVCQERISERWWLEVLRGLVGMWCNIIDEDRDERHGRESLRQHSIQVMRHLAKIARKDDFDEAKQALIEQEPDLTPLFEGA